MLIGQGPADGTAADRPSGGRENPLALSATSVEMRFRVHTHSGGYGEVDGLGGILG